MIPGPTLHQPEIPAPPAWVLRRPWLYLWSALLLVLVAVVDYLTGVELSFSIFYLFSVAAVSWWGTARAGLAFSLVSALAWLVADATGRESSQTSLLLWNTTVRLIFFSIVSMNLSRIRSLLDRERALASTDHVTGVSNGRGFYHALDRELERMRRTNRPMTLAYVDLDNFKTVNDRFGHPAGDDLLRRIALALAGSIRRVDALARLGGDEFAILLPETNESEARSVLTRARTSLADVTAADPIPITATIGALTLRRPVDSIESLVASADELMYRAKQAGKNQLLLESSAD